MRDRQRIVWQLIGLWLLASVLCMAWAWFNTAIIPTPAWVDALFEIGLIFWLLRQTEQVATHLARWLTLVRLSWGLILLVLLAGILWVIFPSTLVPFVFVNNLVEELRSGTPLTATLSTQLVLSMLGLGLLALIIAVAGNMTWLSSRSSIAPLLDTLQARLKLPHFRPERWLARLGRLMLLVLTPIIAVSTFAIVANARIPLVTWHSTISGPIASPNVMALAYDQRNGTLYAGTSNGDVFRSTDNGDRWQIASVGLPPAPVESLLLDDQSNILYVGMSAVSVHVSDGRGNFRYSADGGVYYSTDNGNSWLSANTGLSSRSVSALLLDKQYSTLYAGTSDGVFRSTDNGNSWLSANTGLSSRSVSALLLDKQRSTLYAGTSDGVFRSTDGGNSWLSANAGLLSRSVSALLLDKQRSTLYARTSDGVFRSTDGGSNWQPFSMDLSRIDIKSLLFDESSAALYTGTSNGILRSIDGSSSWLGTNTDLSSNAVNVLLLDTQHNTLYAGTSNGIFRSTDSGNSWQDSSVGLLRISVQALNTQDNTLYAGTRNGIFYSTNGGNNWRSSSAGLPEFSSIQSLLLDKRNNILYAGIRDIRISENVWQGRMYSGNEQGVFRSLDGGNSWQSAKVGLRGLAIRTLLLDENNNTLYAVTDPGLLRLISDSRMAFENVFRSKDNGDTWQALPSGLKDNGDISISSPNTLRFTNSVNTLLLDEHSNTLYAGTNDGLFRSTDGGDSWKKIDVDVPSVSIWTLLLDKQNNMLYAGTSNSLFRSTDGGDNWEKINVDVPSVSIQTSLLDQRNNALYIGTSNGLFRSINGGDSWEKANTGMPNISFQVLLLDEQNNTLYAGTSAGVIRSTDGGSNWQSNNMGLTDTIVDSIAIDVHTGNLYVNTSGGSFLSTGKGSFFSTDNGVHWQATREWPSISEQTGSEGLYDLFNTKNTYGTVTYDSERGVVWASVNGGMVWTDFTARLGLGTVVMRSQSSEHTQLLAPFGNTIAVADLPPGYSREPLIWLMIRAIVWRITEWTADNLVMTIAGLFVLLSSMIAFTYTTLCRPFGIPLWAAILSRRHLESYATPARLEQSTMQWLKTVRIELLQYGDAIADDLRDVPRPFRRYTLRCYAERYAESQSLEARRGRIQILGAKQIQRWHRAWRTTGRALGVQSGMSPNAHRATDELANSLANALGLTLSLAQDFEAVRAYQVEAPALRLNLPPRFPLLFVAEPNPGDHTVQMLVDAVDVLKESGYFALVVPLEPLHRDVDVAAQLRLAIERSPHVQDFIVLSQDAILDILIARRPAQALTRTILEQVDLSVIAPFITSGPVRETMFFGRDAEVKLLVEQASKNNFAIIGNRKIGKTSLLKRARLRLEASGQVRILEVDCQTVRDASGFYSAFQAQTGLTLPSATPERFAIALTEVSSSGPPLVLLLDEVDALLNDERERGEPLVSTWRALAQRDVCHFIFCGSTGLARRLDDPKSAFFNFPQPQPLRYLDAKTAALVLTQPLETLGIIIDDQDALLEEVQALTSGHPNLVQYVGKSLVDAANRRGERHITLADLRALRMSTDFTDYYLKIIWGEAAPLEKLITLVAPADEFRLPEIGDALARHGILVDNQQLDDALKMLQIYTVLQRYERTYSFIPQAFHDTLHRTQEVELLIEQEKRALKPKVA